jgi:hypothetical protein
MFKCNKNKYFNDESAKTALDHATGGPRYSRLLKFDILFYGFGKEEKKANKNIRHEIQFSLSICFLEV